MMKAISNPRRASSETRRSERVGSDTGTD